MAVSKILLLLLILAFQANSSLYGCLPEFQGLSGRYEYERGARDRASLRITSNVPAERRKLVEGAAFFRWDLAEYKRRVGQTIDFLFELGEDGTFVTNQEILTREQLTPRELALSRTLLRLQHSPKFIRKSKATVFKRVLEEEKGYLTFGPAGELVDPAIAAAAAAKYYAGNGVEMAAWRITLADGTVYTAIHGSSNPGRVKPDHYLAAVENLAEKIPNLEKNPPITVQYFHTHPSSGPLSEGDLRGTQDVKHYLASRGINVPVHTYSIGTVGGEPILFHYGVP